MVRNNVVREEERDIYDYGIDQIVFTGLTTLSMIGIGIISKSLWTIFIFSLFYMILRVYAGGYHADTQLKCFVLSNVMIVVVIAIEKYIPISTIFQVSAVILSSIMIAWLGPVDTVTKRLDDLERSIYKKRMLIIMIIENAIFVGSLLTKVASVSKLITVSFLMVLLMLMGGVIDNIKRK